MAHKTTLLATLELLYIIAVVACISLAVDHVSSSALEVLVLYVAALCVWSVIHHLVKWRLAAWRERRRRCTDQQDC